MRILTKATIQGSAYVEDVKIFESYKDSYRSNGKYFAELFHDMITAFEEKHNLIDEKEIL